MPPKKAGKKMDLGAFLADDSLGSWADGDVDMGSVGVPTTAAPILTNYTRSADSFSERRDRVEYPVPDEPPYKARVANLPYDATEDGLARFFEDRLQAHDIVTEVKLPMDQMTGRPKGFAFVTFSEKAALEEALQLTMSEYTGRKIFVNVAAPQKADDNDWRSLRTGPMGGRDRFESDVELDWGAARAGQPKSGGDRFGRNDRFGGDRFGGDRFGDRPKRDEPELDWGSARNTYEQKAPRERAERPERFERSERKEVELDWGSARSAPPPREKREFQKDEWSRGRREKKDEKEFDWKRGQALPAKAPKAKKDDQEIKPQKSVYDVLALDDDEA